ncbi:helix-turn-helix domain-containing protein [Iningainema tapete]|uniref:Helix-turn-helix transcriptional regulator n=1 Tax=Iningainema tapete BLCC-T55 TaxID=2748662 RepID=A0A8J7C889_9CYAN|nr:AraC family transcriptional regulator [Iningainema tapete]MBD2774286.1 helix-turn-helix transcriptional regulator [Iningainema tapete BLCC-T55]
MPADKSLIIDVTIKGAIEQIFPRVPLLSSQKVSWSNIHFAQYQQPACRTAEHCFSQHVISIHSGSPVLKRRMLKGGSQTERFQSGEISITPANQHRTVQLYEKAEFIHIYVEPAFITHFAREYVDADRIEILPQFKLHDPLIHSIGEALKAELQTDGLGSRLYIESMANALCAHLLRYHTTKKHQIQDYAGGLPKSKLRQVVEYINDNLAEDLSLRVIASEVGKSQYHFARLFKKSMGVTLHQYVIQCRVKRAEQLLQDDLSLAEVAYSVGFADQSHFTYHFKRLYGVTPASVREK